jgi:hypothetical protein
MKQIRQLGFELMLKPQSGKTVVGKIAVEKLNELANLGGVRFVAAYRG